MSDIESDKDDLNQEQHPENGQSRKRMSQRVRRNNPNNPSAVERYFKKILTTLNSSSSSSSSNESSGDDENDGHQGVKPGGEDSYESDEDDTDWSSATDQEEDNATNSENREKRIKSANDDPKTSKDAEKIDMAIQSDSSDGSCEKCPICLLSFRDQEIGIPETCDHTFCFICIEEWSKNVSTCPIDRKEFYNINVKENYEAVKVVRKVKVQLNDKTEEDGDLVPIELTFCEVCNNPDREDLMLLCDECNRGYHLFCLSPPLAEVPQGSWYCDNCFSSESSYSDNEVEALLEDVRDLGEPSTRLRTTVRNIPRITRTRQNERLRAAIIARTRYNRNPVVIDPNQPSTSSGFGSIIDAVNRHLSFQNRRTVRRIIRPAAKTKKRTKRRRGKRRVKRQIVEYGLDQDANKFPIEVIKSKKRKKYKKRCGSKRVPTRRNVGGSRELVKSQTGESVADKLATVSKLSLFGDDQLDYFPSDDATDDENSNSIRRHILGVGNSGGSTMVQTTSRTRIGSRRLLNRQKSMALNINSPAASSSITTGPIDLLSSILDTQERWHSTRNLSNVRIADDGRLILENREKKEIPATPIPNPNPNDIIEAPMYPRGGGGNNSGIGGTGRYSGGYGNNNRGGYYNNRGGGGNSSNYRSSTDGNYSGSTSYNNYNNSGGYNQSNDFGGGGNNNFRGGRGRYPINNYTPRGGGIVGNNSGTPNNPNNNVRFKFNRRSLNLPNTSTTTNTDIPTSSIAVQNEEISEGREIVSNSSNIAIDSTSTSEVIIDEIPTPSNIFEPLEPQPNDEDRIGPTSSSINSENIVSSSDQMDKVNDVELNDDEEDDDCPNFSVYSAVSMDIAKESENSSQEVVGAATITNKDAAPNDGNDSNAKGEQNTENMPNTINQDVDDGEKEEDLVQLDDDEVDDDENIIEELPKSSIKTKDDHPGDDDDDDDDDGDDDDKKPAKETIPLEHNKDNLNKNSNNSSNINNKKEKVLELYDDSDWEEWNIDKNDEEKTTEPQKNTEPEPNNNIEDIPIPPQEDKELTEAISEEDERSYTPCLDEKQQKPETNKFNTSNESEAPLGMEPAEDEENDGDNPNETETPPGDPKPATSGIGGLDTEMISDDDEEEIFNEETHQKDDRGQKEGGGHNESNNKTKWIKRRDGNNSFKKISKNTKGRNYRDKDKKRKRSRSRSNDKENKMRGMRKKDKRKDLERYNVRTIIHERPRPTKDKYGRDLSARILKSPTRSKSRQRSGSPRNSRSTSRRRSPVRRSNSRRRSFSPRRRSSSRDPRSRSRQRSYGKARVKRTHSKSRSTSRVAAGSRLNGGKPKAKRHRSRSSKSHSRTRSRSISKSRSFSISRSRTRTPIDRPIKQHPINRRPRKKEARRRELSIEQRSVSPRPVIIKRKKKTAAEKAARRRRSTSYTKWPSRSKTPEISWTPPYQAAPPPTSSQNLTVTLKNKDTVRKKKDKKRKERRKELNERRRDRKRQRADKHASPIPPSKEVFASGNNILVSVSFNKNQEQPPQQTTVVTMPASRSQIVSSKRRDENLMRKARKERNKEGGIGKRHKKVDMKPVAIIDLDRSPFKEMTPSPKDVIVLDDDTDEEREANKEKKTQDTQEKGVNLQLEEDTEPPMRVQQASQPQSPVVDDSFDLLSPGPKTPPEPPTVKFSMSVKSKNTKLRAVNPLHDAVEEEPEVLCERDTESAASQKDQNKIGPNTPPEPAPTSPDAYDPFEPTKSPSPSPSPAPPDIGDMSTNDDDVSDNLVESTQECINEDNKRLSQTQEKILNPVELVMALINNKTASVAAASSSAHADITSTSGDNFNLQTSESQIIDIASMQSSSPGDKVDDPHKQITVLSNIFIQSGTNQTSQSRVTNVAGSLLLPTMSNSGRSPIKSQFNNPTSTTNKSSPIKSITLTKQTSQKIITLTTLPKSAATTNNNNSSGGGASGANISDLGGDDGGNDFGSPYSPGSSDYDDLFEPPMDTSSPPPVLPPMRSHKSQANKNTKNSNPIEMFDNLFGSTSPINHNMRLSSNKPKSKQMLNKMHKKTPVKVYHKPGMGKLSDDQLQILDDLPSSAVELQVKDKFLRKLNRQERVVEEVKLVLKPHYNKKHVSKEEYKNIMRRAVPKICHNRTGEINPQKIQNLIEAYVKKYRHRRKLLNNNAVSSSNKCVDFLNKLN